MKVYLLHDGYDGPRSAHLTQDAAIAEKERVVSDDIPVKAREHWERWAATPEARKRYGIKHASFEDSLEEWTKSAEDTLWIEEMPVS